MCLPGLFGSTPEVTVQTVEAPPTATYAPEVAQPTVGTQQDTTNRKIGKRRFKTQTLDTIGTPKTNQTFSGGGVGLPTIGSGGNSGNPF